MKVLASLSLVAFTSACLIASPALAGPRGSGLPFTVEVAKKNQEKRAAARAQAADAAPCATPKATAENPSPAASKDTAPRPETCRAS